MFEEMSVSKETLIKRLNGKLRAAIWTTIGLLIFGTIVGLIYWRRSVIAEEKAEETRKSAVAILLRAIDYRDSLERERDSVAYVDDQKFKAEVRDALGIYREKMKPFPAKQEPDTAYLREQLEGKK